MQKNEETPLSVEEYRAIASKADQEAYRLWEIREKLEEEQFDIDSIYFMSGEDPIYKAKHDSLQHLMDSLDMLIHVQDTIMNKEPTSPYMDVNIRCIFDTLANFNTKYYNL